MSQRVKKPGRPPAEDSQGKRRCRPRRPSGSEDADGDDAGTRSGSNSGLGGGGGGGGNGSLTGMWTPRHLNDLKVSSIYNRNSAEAPAELYRKDLISAMKLPDSEPLTPEEYWLITDSWKQEWEKGVQVPVNPESLPEPEVKLIQPVAERSHDFRLPKKKYVRVTHDDFFNPDYHQLVSTAARAEKVCSYDLDDVDAAWLGCSNADRAMQNTTLISEFLMEQVIEELELQCWEQVQTILKSQEGLGIEYDENVICDVCRSPESEEGNEMVFCDSCNICVHQACYGITSIPSGSWLCRTCTLGIKPACVLCPNVGGAMKATRSGHTWAHVACAIWIPEVSIGSVEKMEPITKISSIPQSRWSLVCVLCKEKTGACIQCSVKTCKTAYHVTCAFKNGLEMKPIIVDENAEDGIKLRSYCEKHSVNTKNKAGSGGGHQGAVVKVGGGLEIDEQEKKRLKAMTAEERNIARAEKLQQIESEFYKYVRLKDVSGNLAVDMDVVILIYNYWKLKRKSLNNRPLVPPRPETTQLLTQQQEQDLEQMKMFVQLRQDLERVRNLCYMVSRREKLSRSFFRLKEQTFQKQLALLSEPNELSGEERQAVLAANHGPSIYDQFYSCAGVPLAPPQAVPTAGPSSGGGGPTSSIAMKGGLPDYETLISMIAGGLEQKKETLMNGIIKAAGGGGKRQSKAAEKEPLPGTSGGKGGDRKQFVNGARVGGKKGAQSESEDEDEGEVKGKGKKIVTPKATPSPGVKGKKGKAAQAKAAAVASTAVVEVKVKGGKGGSVRKPLSYLFDSDSSVENALPGKVEPVAQAQVKKKGATAQGKGVKGKGGKVPPASVPQALKGVKGKAAQAQAIAASYLSDSDELELPVAAVGGGGKEGKGNDKPIYSDSEEEEGKEEEKKKGGRKKAVKVTASPVGKKGKGQQQLVKEKEEDVKLEKVPETPSPIKKGRGKVPAVQVSPVKGKGKAGGRKGKKGQAGWQDPTELIVPQREAAKKATESIGRAVKQKGKEETVVKEEIDKKEEKEEEKVVVIEKKKTRGQQVTSTLSESEDEEEEEKPQTSRQAQMTTRKGTSPERRGGGGKGRKGEGMIGAGEEEEEGEGKGDEFEFDLEKEAKNVSYVPQRQAAKKAAEHIRSGLSNIVAARLIIEDEMEATRRKQKTTGSKEGVEGEEATLAKDKIETAVAEAAKKVTSKAQGQQRGVSGGKVVLKKGEGLSGVGPGGAAVSGDLAARGGSDTADWPFLDKGSQSACRRSRERSSSSGSSSDDGSSDGSSSSSNSSCSSSRSGSSASSSRSSSAQSASPEPRNPALPLAASSKVVSEQEPVCASTAATSGPGRKLKTSERVSKNTAAPQAPVRQPSETAPPREKPAAKGGRSTKSGPRGGGDPFRSAFSPSPEPEECKPTSASSSIPIPSTNHDKVSPPSKGGSRAAHEKLNRSSARGAHPAPPPPPHRAQRASPLSPKKAGGSPAAGGAVPSQVPQKKGGRRKGESPAAKQGAPVQSSRGASKADEKDGRQEEEEMSSSATSTTPSTRLAAKNAGQGEKRSPPKALGRGRGSPIKSLAHHTGPQLSSESETESPAAPPIAPPQSIRKLSSQSPPQKKRARSSGATLALSDSDSATEEKENASASDQRQKSKGTPTHRGAPPGTPNSSLPQTSSILSPLTPTENKEKDHPSRLSDTEQPESKRPRLQSTSSSPDLGGDRDRDRAPSSSANIKSIFSPTGSTGHGGGGNRDHDMSGYDFDSELYDLAKSVVTEEYTHGQEDGEESVGYSLHLNFTAGLFTGEDNREDSTQATLNLVKKLRQQHQAHAPTTSGGHRSSTDCMSGEEPSPNSSRPSSSLQFHRGEESLKNSPAPQGPSSADQGGTTAPEHVSSSPSKPIRGAFAAISQMKSPLHSSVATSASPDRTKQSIQGDERWVPPSSPSPHKSSSSPPHPPHHHLRSPPYQSQQPSRSSAEKSSGALSVDTLPSPAPSPSTSSISASPLVSPLLGPPALPPPYSQHSALAAAMQAASDPTSNPFGPSFMPYRDLANNPAAFASVVNSLAAAAASGAPHPLAPFLSQQGRDSKVSPSTYPQFIQPPPPTPTSSVPTPTPSPGGGGASESKSGSSTRTSSQVSPLVSLATSMPSLSKPPLTSPSSILLSAASSSHHLKSVCAPPLQSAVAHIIESVVNNHQAAASSSNLPKTTLSLDMMHLLGGPPPSQPLPQVKTPLSSPLLAKAPQSQHSPISPISGKTPTPLSSPKFKDPQPTQVASQPPPPPVSQPSGAAGAGRGGRRASTPRAAKQAAEKLSGVSAVIEDMLGPVPAPPPPSSTPSKSKGGRKGASPGRGAKASSSSSTPSKRGGPSGGGRGKGKGKNLVGVRKDLAGTVYDIDFDEFEEEAQEKIDLRSLRERRKSSEVHHSATVNSSPLVLTLPVPSAYKQSKEEKRAQREKEKQERDRERELAKQQKQLEKQMVKQQKAQAKLLEKQQREREREEQREKEREKEVPLVAPLKITLNDSIRQQQQREQQQDAKEAKEREQVKAAEREKVEPKRPMAAILQTPLPGPVDMRTYSGSGAGASIGGTSSSSSGIGGGMVSQREGEEKNKLLEKIGFPAASKDPSVEIASLFGMPTGTGGARDLGETSGQGSSAGTSSSTVVNELEELDKALDDLVSTKQPPTSQPIEDLPSLKPVTSVNLTGSESEGRSSPLSFQQRPTVTQPTLPISSSAGPPAYSSTGGTFANGSGQDKAQDEHLPLIMPTSSSNPPALPSAEPSDICRNQLKVKIKGPFLDANYSTSQLHQNPLVTQPVMHPHHHPAAAALHAYHSHHSLHQPAVPQSVPPQPGMYPPPPSHYPPHHHHQHWMMNSSGASTSSSGAASNSMDNNPSNLRRMRKKELLRKYWTEDGGGDGGTSSSSSANPYPSGYPTNLSSGSHHQGGGGGGHGHEGMGGSGGLQGHHGGGGGPPSHHHPLGRSVITIPKAVASMSILPSTQDDHEGTGNEGGMDFNDPLGFNRFSDANWNDGKLGKDGGGGAKGTQKKRRSRGIFREMAALGLPLPEGQGQRNERRRDKGQGASGGGTQSPSGSTGTGSDSNSRKRMRASNKPSRSTFIPPTLAEGADSPGGGATSGGKGAVVNVVNHPTPKLKIKFGDMSGGGGQGSGNANHLSDSSDKELPASKKAKGRPPKKRGLPDQTSTSSRDSLSGTTTTSGQVATGQGAGGGMSMELLKRESMKYREMIMKDYAKAEQQEILKLSGTRRGKKKKRKKGGGGEGESEGGSDGDAETSSVRSKSPPGPGPQSAEVKVIEGPKPKLILRFGGGGKKKGRKRGEGGSETGQSDNSCNSSGRNSALDKKMGRENGLTVGGQQGEKGGAGEGENDSGFTTASGEGSSGSGGSSLNDDKAGKDKQSGPPAQGPPPPGNNNNNDDKGIRNGGQGEGEGKGQASGEGTSAPSGGGGGEEGDKPYVPIRLKLSRCYEGSYALKNKEGGKGGSVEETEGGATAPAAETTQKQSDSCQVR